MSPYTLLVMSEGPIISNWKSDYNPLAGGLSIVNAILELMT